MTFKLKNIFGRFTQKTEPRDEMRYLYYTPDQKGLAASVDARGELSQPSVAFVPDTRRNMRGMMLDNDDTMAVAYNNNSSTPPQNQTETDTLVWSGRESQMKWMGKLSSFKHLGTAEEINGKLKSGRSGATPPSLSR